MAQTWPISRKRIAALKAVDILGRAIAAPFKRSQARWSERPSRILVIEPWNVGDVVLSTSILAELRARYPQARISLLAKPYAVELLKESPLVDEIITADLPWTAQRDKYPVDLHSLRQLALLVKRLRAERFDVTIDSRMDIRSNLLAAMTGARRRVGYDIGGGGWLLTNTLPSDRSESHKLDDWRDLLDLIPGKSTQPSNRPRPTLTVTAAERTRADESLRALGVGERPVIAYHPGGSHPGKRWPLRQFERLISELRGSVGGSHVVLLGPGEEAFDSLSADAVTIRPSLRELMALVSCCDVLVCNDSGPMHIADALGVPVVAIFEVGNPQWFGPSGPRAEVVRGELAGTGVSAAPLDTPPANPVPVTCVADVVRRTLRAQA